MCTRLLEVEDLLDPSFIQFKLFCIVPHILPNHLQEPLLETLPGPARKLVPLCHQLPESSPLHILVPVVLEDIPDDLHVLVSCVHVAMGRSFGLLWCSGSGVVNFTLIIFLILMISKNIFINFDE